MTIDTAYSDEKDKEVAQRLISLFDEVQEDMSACRDLVLSDFGLNDPDADGASGMTEFAERIMRSLVALDGIRKSLHQAATVAYGGESHDMGRVH